MSAPYDTPASPLIGSSARSVTTVDDEVARLSQALVDLKECQSTGVSVIHVPSVSQEKQLVRSLTETASDAGFVAAHLPLDEYPVDAIDGLVAALLDALVSPGGSREKGLLHLLDLFYERHGTRALDRFDRACEETGVSGDLSALCRAYLAAEDDAHREVKALTSWALGKSPSARLGVVGVRGTLDVHTGQRVFGHLTRLVRALGHAGLVLILSRGDALTTRTERQREKGYTLLREFIDNFDSGHGAVSTKIILTGGAALFEGPRSLQALAPLFARLSPPSDAEPPPPHRTWSSLIREPYEYIHRAVRPPRDVRPKAMRTLVRLSQGLPPIDASASLSVGHEKIDKSIDRLFQHAEMSGSVFQILSGEYGSGKTHLLLHLSERALENCHPVFWLNLERMNLDLGNPARHYTRVLDQSVLPVRGRPSALERLAHWTRSPARIRSLIEHLTIIAEGDGHESKAAKRALASLEASDQKEDAGAILENFLAGRDLQGKSSGVSYRKDAYRRLLLLVELMSRLEGLEGPVLLIDEAENLYTSGVTEPARRSALRTLSFYCGGALPGACVILAMTPPAFVEMKKESAALLRDAAEMSSTLDLEDVDLFKRRLSKLAPDDVPAFTRPMRHELAKKVRNAHKKVRGPVELQDWDALVQELVKVGGTPRALMRRLVDELEAAWWAGG